MNISVTNKSLSFNGNHVDAHELTVEIRRAYNSSGLEMSNLLNDFLFTTEVTLQEIGYLTEDFDVDSNFEEPKDFRYSLHSGDEICFQNKFYTILEIEWEGEIAKILGNHIDNGTRRIECHVSEIS